MHLLQQDVGKYKKYDRHSMEDIDNKMRKLTNERDYFKEKAVALKQSLKNEEAKRKEKSRSRSKSKDRNKQNQQPSL